MNDSQTNEHQPFSFKMSQFWSLPLMKLERCVPGGHPDTAAALLPLSDIQLRGIMGSREAFAQSSFSSSHIVHVIISIGKPRFNTITGSGVAFSSPDVRLHRFICIIVLNLIDVQMEKLSTVSLPVIWRLAMLYLNSIWYICPCNFLLVSK